MTDRKPPPLPRPQSYPPERAPQRQQPSPYDDPYFDTPPGELWSGGPPTPPSPPRRPRRRSGTGPLGMLVYALTALIALAVGAAIVFFVALPTDLIRDRIVAEVKNRTGRDLVLKGPISFTFYPSIGVSLSDVALSGPPGTNGEPLVAMDALDVGVELMPLLRREVRVNRLLLKEPKFNLVVDAQGRKSWEFTAAETPELVRLAQAAPTDEINKVLNDSAAPPAPPPAAAPSRLKLENISLDDVRVVNGSLHYADLSAGSEQNVGSINVAIALASIEAPLTAKGSLFWKGKKQEFTATLTSLKEVIEDRPVKVALTLANDIVNASFDGTASLKTLGAQGALQFALANDLAKASFNGTASFKDAIQAQGAIDTKVPSARKLASWLGTELPPSKGFGPFSAKGAIRVAGSAITLSGSTITLDAISARGDLGVETSGARPMVTANLKINELNLNTYARTEGTSRADAPAPAKAKEADAKAEKKPAKSIDDLLDDAAPSGPGPKVKAFRERAGWSEELIDVTPLKLVDANAKLSLGKLFVEEIKVGQTDATVTLSNGSFKANFADIALYEGHGKGYVAIDGSTGKAANVGANMTLDGISAQPLLTDAADLNWLAGKGKLTFSLAGQGRNQRQIIETLNGKVDFSFADGAIVGINIPGMVRGLQQGRIGDLKTAPTEKTDFSELSSTWTVAQGVAQNKDLKMISPLLRLTGAGSVMLPPREIDYTLKPKVVADLAGQGGKVELAGIEIPIRVHGSWDKPKLTPDLAGAFKDPNKAVETIKKIGDQFKGKNAKDIVKDILGTGKEADNGSGAAPVAKQLLDKFLNKQPQQPQ